MARPNVTQQRLTAWLIDLVITVGLGLFFGGVGWIAGTGYWLLRDGFFDGQSIGKRLLALNVVMGPDRARCTSPASAIRNVLWVIPLINLVMGFTGRSDLSRDRAGRHWGDRLADPRVLRTAS
jgi:hypothetical protein